MFALSVSSSTHIRSPSVGASASVPKKRGPSKIGPQWNQAFVATMLGRQRLLCWRCLASTRLNLANFSLYLRLLCQHLWQTHFRNENHRPNQKQHSKIFHQHYDALMKTKTFLNNIRFSQNANLWQSNRSPLYANKPSVIKRLIRFRSREADLRSFAARYCRSCSANAINNETCHPRGFQQSWAS